MNNTGKISKKQNENWFYVKIQVSKNQVQTEAAADAINK